MVRIIFLMELAGLKGREKLKNYDVRSVIRYEGNECSYEQRQRLDRKAVIGI